MIPVFQNKFYMPNVSEEEQRGNCLTAVVASLLELPIEAVPNFVEIDVLGGPNWWWLAHRYIELMNKEMIQFNPRNPPSGYYTLSGPSPRGSEECPIFHIVIFKDGKLAHDPYPDGQGCLNYWSGWYLKDTGGSY